MEKSEQDRIRERNARIREDLIRLANVYKKTKSEQGDKYLALSVIRDLVADWV